MDKNILQSTINKYNLAYRQGESLVSDEEYDKLINEYIEKYGNDDFINEIGFENIADSRMQELPIIMGSMNKIKTIEEYKKWLVSKNIPDDTLLVLTPKYDGLSLCTDEETKDAWTRGNGITGQYSPKHFELIGINPHLLSAYAFGEVIMKRNTFLEKYSEDFANPRNMVAGQLNHKTPSEILTDCDYIRYGIEIKDGTQINKLTQLDICNQLNAVEVPFETCNANELTVEKLTDLFAKWSKEYEIDGIIIDINDSELRTSLGRETSKPNPAYARAFKGNFEEVKETQANSITYEVSKFGKLAPVAQVNPVSCDGATVSNVTLYNAAYVKNMGITPGVKITVKRAGMVIPKIVEVLNPGEVELPTVCPECNKPVVWTYNKKGEEVDLMCINPECPATKIKKLYSFFKIIDADNFSEGTINTVVEAGFDTISKILKMTISDFEKLERIGKKKATNIYNGIHSKLDNINIAKVQHASSLFVGLGSKKLALIDKYIIENNKISKCTQSEIESIPGFSEKSARIYLDAIDLFTEWVQYLPINIIRYKAPEEPIGNSFKDEIVVFTGYRNKDAEAFIISQGGKIGKKVNSKATMLVMKQTGSGTSKEKDALKLGIKILNKDEFEKLLK